MARRIIVASAALSLAISGCGSKGDGQVGTDEPLLGQWACRHSSNLPSTSPYFIIEITPDRISEISGAEVQGAEISVRMLRRSESDWEDSTQSITTEIATTSTVPSIHKAINSADGLPVEIGLNLGQDRLSYSLRSEGSAEINRSVCVRRELTSAFDRFERAYAQAEQFRRQTSQYSDSKWYTFALMVRNAGYCSGFRNTIINTGVSNSAMGEATANQLLPVLQSNGCIEQNPDSMTFPELPGIPIATMPDVSDYLETLHGRDVSLDEHNSASHQGATPPPADAPAVPAPQRGEVALNPQATIRLSGRYEYLSDEMSLEIYGNQIFFYPDATSSGRVPRRSIGDGDIRFSFDNGRAAAQMLGISMQPNGSSCGYEGTATVEVSNYIPFYGESDADNDAATLQRVVVRTPSTVIPCEN